MQKRKKAVNGLKIFIIFHLMCFVEGKKTKKPMGHIATVLVSLFKKMMKVIYDIEKLTKIIYSDFTIHKTYI